MHTRVTSRTLLHSFPPSCVGLHIRNTSSRALKSRKTTPWRSDDTHRDLARTVTLKIMKSTVKHPHSWEHSKTLRGEEMRLTNSILHSSGSGMSVERSEFEAGQEIDSNDDDSAPLSLPPGTFVETRRNNITSLGVVVGEMYKDRRRRLFVLNPSGEVWQPIQQDILYIIPDFVPCSLALRAGELPFHENHVQLHARVQILKHLRELEKKLEVVQNIVVSRCDKLYNTIMSTEPETWKQISIPEVAGLIPLKTDQITRFAIHSYLFGNSLYFTAHDYYQGWPIFFVRPKSHVNNINTILEWTRRSDSPIKSFAKKARIIIKDNQKLPHSETPVALPAVHTWTDDDQTILRFLLRSLRRTRSIQSDPYSIGQSFILKRISLEQPAVSDHTVHQLLINLGVLPPWQDPMTLDPFIGLDQEPEATSLQVKATEAVVTKSMTSITSSKCNSPLGPEDFYPSDPLESVRHDFGDMPVYVIDEPTAEELDDGVSIEQIPSEPDSYWAHVHVADPAALIPPTHVFAKEAKRRVESLYFIDRSWPLFPRSLMKHPQCSLSLGSGADGEPMKVITFSSKINNLGELTDFKVRAGLVRNFHIVTYDEVDAALDNPPIVRSYPLGLPKMPAPPLRKLSTLQIQDLRILQALAGRVVAKRFRDNVLAVSTPFAEVRRVTQLPQEMCTVTYEPTTFQGFPLLDYMVSDTRALDTGARNLVAEMMKLSSRVGSLFCTQQGIPNIRRACDPRLMRTYEDPEKLLSLRDPSCYLSTDDAITKMESFPPGEYSLEPKAHYAIGLSDGEGYCRVTSPLRRYIDMVSHWQIHHGLLGFRASQASPPFSNAQLSDLIVSTTATAKLVSKITRTHEEFWQVMAVKQWMDGIASGLQRDYDPLEHLEALSISAPSMNLETAEHHAEATLPTLGLSLVIEGLQNPRLPPGSRLPVKITDYKLGVRPKLCAVEKIK